MKTTSIGGIDVHEHSKLEIPDVNNDDAYFYEDHNGYSYVVS